MNKYDIEDELLTNILNGDVYEVTSKMPKDMLENEFADFLYTWSVFNKSERFQGAMARHIHSMCQRIADHLSKIDGLDSNCVDEEGNWLEECDRYYDDKKDRQAEGM
jgi:hypothetical protein